MKLPTRLRYIKVTRLNDLEKIAYQILSRDDPRYLEWIRLLGTKPTDIRLSTINLLESQRFWPLTTRDSLRETNA